MMNRFLLSQKRAFRGFTLIELLVTLSIMAILSAMLFPFVQNYQYNAKTTAAWDSLKIMQDGMVRYMQMNEEFNPNTWGASNVIDGPWDYGTNADEKVTFCARVGDSYGNQIVSDMTEAGSNQVIKFSPFIQQTDAILFYRTGPATNMLFWPVFYNIDESDDVAGGNYTQKNDYVNRQGKRVSSASNGGFPNDSTYIINLFR